MRFGRVMIGPHAVTKLHDLAWKFRAQSIKPHELAWKFRAQSIMQGVECFGI